jgi:hypothetical protein
MRCEVCEKEGAVKCYFNFANIILAQGLFCSRSCMRKALPRMHEQTLKSIACMDKDFMKHVTSQCDCIPQ